MEWFVEYEPGEPTAHPDGWTDGITREVDDLDRDQFVLHGRALRVEWLEGADAQNRLTARGW